ncbi:MAG: magnesium transporter [Gammaproteobacteria bacterium BRH_c0]|nr:MAG: magnesium transporter [Gammaproteobacteria bacterium BRH_c0]
MSEEDHQGQDKSWLERLTQAFSFEPKTTEDVVEILRVAHTNKIIDNDALEIMEGALHVSDQQVREIMVPRSQMVMIRQDASLDEVLNIATESNHSRFPVTGESTDDVKGILLAKDLLQVACRGETAFNLCDFVRPANIIPESKRLNVLLRDFREKRYHMAVVVDEYGGIAGLVTIEDVLEEIVGDIEDETDDAEQEMIQQVAEDRYLVAALTPVEEFNEYFDSGLSEEEFDTIGGILLQAFGQFPEVGESIAIDDLTFTVKDGDKRQIRQVEVAVNPSPRL